MPVQGGSWLVSPVVPCTGGVWLMLRPLLAGCLSFSFKADCLHHTGALQMATGSVYLPNNYQVAFVCDAVVPAHVAITKASAYAKRHKKAIYVPGVGNFDEDGNQVDPQPPDPPEPDKTIGTATATGDDVNDKGDTVIFDEGAETTVTAGFSGDAEDVNYKWAIRSGGEYISIVGDSTKAAVVLSADGSGGAASAKCTLASATATDSPQELVLNVIVQPQAGPDSAKTSRTKK